MCLYERKLPNGKYEPTIKNGGNVPECKDYRKLYINVGCGWCSECRKKIANEWKIRLQEDIKENKKCEGVTLSFSPENIEKLETEIYNKGYRGIETDENGEIELDVNILAAYAVRMWSERWRKYFKKAPRHWLVTELGHEKSERLHLHGLVWHDFKDKQTFMSMLEKTWKYGNIRLGQWVDGRTVNYLTKYITKLDEFHKGYKQRTFVSKGIGKCYVEKYKNWHKYKGEQTITYYKGYKGYKYGLPRYWKLKLWNEEERDKIWSLQLDKNETYLGQTKYDTTKDDKDYIEKYRKHLKGLREHNENCGYGNNETGTKKYIITPLMKLKYKDVINYNKEKLIKCVNKRIIQNIIPYEEIENRIGKDIGVNKIIWGEIQGNLTEGDRKYNGLLREAAAKRISVKKVRLIHAGIIPDVNYKY